MCERKSRRKSGDKSALTTFFFPARKKKTNKKDKKLLMNVDIVGFHHPLGLGNRKKFWMELLVNRDDCEVPRLEARQMASIGIHKRHHTVLRHGFLRLKTRGNKTRDMEGRKETGVTIHHDD